MAKWFDALVVQRVSSHVFELHDPIPDWYPRSPASTEFFLAPLDLLQQSHFLQSFLEEAEKFWLSSEEGYLRSGLWSEPEYFGQDIFLEATAVVEEGRHQLVVQQVTSDIHPLKSVLQKAREAYLLHDRDRQEWEHAKSVLTKRLQQHEQVNEDLTTMLDRLPMGSLLVDRTGRILYANHHAIELLGPQALPPKGQWVADVFELSEGEWMNLKSVLELPHGTGTSIGFPVPKGFGRKSDLEMGIHDGPQHSSNKVVLIKEAFPRLATPSSPKGSFHFHELIGASDEMQGLYQTIGDVARVEVPVLIQGETGTGKELVARAIHQLSARANRAFVAVNCAGLTESLLGSQLFGHRKGAFTGAMYDQEGFFEAAQGGTLFLDEIGDMPHPVQTILLRALQEKEIIRLGESKPRKVDVRVLAASNQHLQELVRRGQFRADLFYRIRVARLDLPPLRKRPGDISLLCQAFLERGRGPMGKPSVESFSVHARQHLLHYPWPGNVRELKSAVEYALIRCSGRMIQPGDLPPEVRCFMDESTDAPQAEGKERDHILQALRQTQGKRSQAAKVLGMSRSTLYRRLRDLNISWSQFRE